MPFEKKYPGDFTNGGGDFDSAPFRVAPNQTVNMENCRIGTTDAGETGTVESVGSTILIENPYLFAGNNIEIGSGIDEVNNRIIVCIANDQGNDAIFAYELFSETWYKVLLADQVIGGLNFDPLFLITGRVVNGNFYWNDEAKNEPRRLNIDAGIKMNHSSYVTSVVPYVAPLNFWVIAWIRRQPGLPPTQLKIIDPTLPNNIFISDNGFNFAYRYIYKDFEPSTLSGYSNLADFNEQDPPPIQTSLNVPNTSLVTRGYLATNYLLPSSPTPPYGPGVLAKITRVGTGGASAVSTDIPIILDWTGYPITRNYNTVIVEGINDYFKNLPTSDNPGNLSTGNPPQTVGCTSCKWYISSRDGIHPTLNILETWDWGLGDSAFAPTVEANLTLYTQVPAPSRQFNRIDIEIPLSEKIDQDVVQIDLVAQNLISSTFSIIKSWRTAIPADVAAIAAHNALVNPVPLTYSFFNNQGAITLEPAYTEKPYDSVPIATKTFEFAKNRAYMSNFKLGYNSANLLTSLAITAINTVLGNPIGGNVTGEWYFALMASFPPKGVYYMITTSSITPQPFSPQYYYTTLNAAPPFPTTISTGLIFIGTTFAQVLQYYNSGGVLVGPTDQHQSSAILSQNPSVNFGVLAKAFKQNAPYQIGISFLDYAGRKGGIITNSNLLITIPNIGFSANTYVTALNWILSNLNALTEIPVEAFYFSINITKCLRTRFFVEAAGFVIYAAKDASGNYTFNEEAYSTDWAGVAIDLTFLVSNGMGYVFTPGDICNFYLNGANYSLAVIGQSGKYVVLQLANVGSVGSASIALFELYTPYQQVNTEPYYEVSQIYPISNPGTANRQYSVLSGTIAGDVFVFQRQNFNITYIDEAMSPSDKLYKYWFTDAGRTNFIDFIGQTLNYNAIPFSNVLLPGSQNNGLSTFDALNVVQTYLECGPVRKLQLTSKVAGQEGSIMLAICEDETQSLYLGEVQLVGASSNVALTQTENVIGTINILKGSFGTINPESVFEFRGNVFYYDAKNGKWIQYSSNGLFPISNYRITRYWKLFSDLYLSLTQDEIIALGSRPFVFSAVDPHNWELLCTVPKLSNIPPKGYLPDYPDMIYPFDIWDAQAKSIVYKLNADPNYWIGAFNITAEGYAVIQNKVFSFKNGQMYQHNDEESFGNFYGTQYKSRIMLIGNQMPSKPKVYNSIAVEANARPSLTYFRTEPTLTETEQYDLWEQASDLADFSYSVKEGQLYAVILRNKLVPTQSGLLFTGLLTAEKIRALTLKILIEFSTFTYPLELRFITLGYSISHGHETV